MKNTTRFLALAILVLIVFSSCQQKGIDSIDNTAPFFNDSIFQEIKKGLPKDWTLTNDSSQTLVLVSNKPIQICDFSDVDMGGVEVDDSLIKKKRVGNKPFQVRFRFAPVFTQKDIETYFANGKKINELATKYGVDQLEQRGGDYVARNSTDSLNIIKFKSQRDEIIKHTLLYPNMITKKYSIYITTNLPSFKTCICDPNDEGNMEDVVTFIKNVVTKGE